METYSSSLENGLGLANLVEHNVFYGAGMHKLASIVGCSTAKAKKILDDFWGGNQGVYQLVESLKKQYQQYGFIVGLDGRKFRIRQDYKLLNSLIQGGAGIIWKRWGVIANERLREAGLDCKQVIAMHDEYQYECPEIEVPLATSIIETAAIDSGRYYNLNVPVTAEIKVGKNWAETH
jgi:DNA polymerase I-like protein with 3'-5' exonuclease and polymerase domains